MKCKENYYFFFLINLCEFNQNTKNLFKIFKYNSTAVKGSFSECKRWHHHGYERFADWSALDSDDRKGAGLSTGIRIEEVRSDRLPGVCDSFTERSDDDEVKQPPFLQLPSYKALL